MIFGTLRQLRGTRTQIEVLLACRLSYHAELHGWCRVYAWGCCEAKRPRLMEQFMWWRGVFDSFHRRTGDQSAQIRKINPFNLTQLNNVKGAKPLHRSCLRIHCLTQSFRWTFIAWNVIDVCNMHDGNDTVIITLEQRRSCNSRMLGHGTWPLSDCQCWPLSWNVILDYIIQMCYKCALCITTCFQIYYLLQVQTQLTSARLAHPEEGSANWQVISSSRKSISSFSCTKCRQAE